MPQTLAGFLLLAGLVLFVGTLRVSVSTGEARSWPSHCIALSVVLLVTSAGCGTMVHPYPGPKRPFEALAIVWDVHQVRIDAVDGEEIEVKKSRDVSVALLGGCHCLLVQLKEEFSVARMTWDGTIHYKMRRPEGFSPRELCVYLEEGNTYYFSGVEIRWSEGVPAAVSWNPRLRESTGPGLVPSLKDSDPVVPELGECPTGKEE